MTNAEFVKKHYGQALVASKGSGIFIETLLGQSILETSSGKSVLSSKYNNYFGIKGERGPRNVTQKILEVKMEADHARLIRQSTAGKYEGRGERKRRQE